MLQEGPSPVSGIAPSGDGRAIPGRRSFQSSFQYIELASIGHGGEPGILHQLTEDEFEVVHFLCSKRESHFVSGMTLRFLNQPSEPLPTHNPTLPLSRSFKSSTVRTGTSEPFTKAATFLPLTTSFNLTHESGSGAGVIANSYLPGRFFLSSLQSCPGMETY